MATLPLWAVGRHVTAYTLTPQSVNATSGVLADVSASAQTIYGHMRDCEVEQNVTLENISSMDSLAENNIPIEFGTSYRITELEKSAGTNKLAYLVNSGYNFFKAALTRGGQSWTGYAVISNYRMSAQKNGVAATFELRPVQVVDTATTANPIYG